MSRRRRPAAPPPLDAPAVRRLLERIVTDGGLHTWWQDGTWHHHPAYTQLAAGCDIYRSLPLLYGERITTGAIDRIVAELAGAPAAGTRH